jgi:hypothetical protein
MPFDPIAARAAQWWAIGAAHHVRRSAIMLRSARRASISSRKIG